MTKDRVPICSRCGGVSWWRDQDGDLVCIACGRPARPVRRAAEKPSTAAADRRGFGRAWQT